MGEISKPNLALSIPLLLELINFIERKIQETDDLPDKHRWLVFLTYTSVSYVVSLRGPEGFLLDLSGLNQYWNHSKDYTVIALLGRIKGEHHDLSHLIPCANVTSSGINLKNILKRLLNEKARLGFTIGPAISDANGKLYSSKSIDDMLHEALTNIFHNNASLFPIQVDKEEKIYTSYQCFRTFRRTSDTRAIEEGVSTTDINIVNRWKATEDAKGKKPSHSMHLHYAQLELLVEPFLRYTSKM